MIGLNITKIKKNVITKQKKHFQKIFDLLWFKNGLESLTIKYETYYCGFYFNKFLKCRVVLKGLISLLNYF